MHTKSLALHGAALAAVAVAVMAGSSSATAQYRGGGSMPMAAPVQSGTYNMRSQSAGQPATTISNPTTKLASAHVEDSDGQTVGQVQNVSTTSDGKASAVNVWLTTSGGTGKVVSIGATDLSYEAASHTLKASLTLSQINSLPATQSP